MQDQRPAPDKDRPDDPRLEPLIQALRERKHSRRDLARYGLALGLSAAALPAFLAACGDDDDDGGGGGGGGGDGQGKLIDAAPDGADLAKPEPFKYASEEMTIDDALAFKVPKANDNYKIAYMLISLQGYYFVAAAYGADQAGKDAGVEIQRVAAEGYASPDVQQQQLGDLLQKNIDAVVVLPADVNGSVALVDQAQAAGVVLTVAGSLLNSNKVAQAVQSDYALGQQSADLVAEQLDGSGGVGLIMGGPKQATWAVHRVAGFNAQIEEKYPEMEVGVTTHQNFVDPTEGLEHVPGRDTAAAGSRLDLRGRLQPSRGAVAASQIQGKDAVRSHGPLRVVEGGPAGRNSGGGAGDHARARSRAGRLACGATPERRGRAGHHGLSGAGVHEGQPRRSGDPVRNLPGELQGLIREVGGEG